MKDGNNRVEVEGGPSGPLTGGRGASGDGIGAPPPPYPQPPPRLCMDCLFALRGNCAGTADGMACGGFEPAGVSDLPGGDPAQVPPNRFDPATGELLELDDGPLGDASHKGSHSGPAAPIVRPVPEGPGAMNRAQRELLEQIRLRYSPAERRLAEGFCRAAGIGGGADGPAARDVQSCAHDQRIA